MLNASKGALVNLTLLGLPSNLIGDAGMIAFANAIKPTPQNPMGALPRLEDLFLNQNAIGDAGVTALAGAITRGSLPALSSVGLAGNPGDRAPVDKALAEREN